MKKPASKATRTHVTHEFPALYDRESRVLLLGSIPSPKSREMAFYYGHPQNRFWKVMAIVLGEEFPKGAPEAIAQKKAMLKKHHIALWDVLAVCDIAGASDASIRNPVPNDIPWMLRRTRITRIYATGKTAFNLYEKLVFPTTGIHAVCLPSTSPANQALFPWPKLVETWRQLFI